MIGFRLGPYEITANLGEDLEVRIEVLYNGLSAPRRCVSNGAH